MSMAYLTKNLYNSPAHSTKDERANKIIRSVILSDLKLNSVAMTGTSVTRISSKTETLMAKIIC